MTEQPAPTLAVDDLSPAEKRYFDRRLDTTSRFAHGDASVCPTDLRRGVSHRAFKALSPKERLEVVRASILSAMAEARVGRAPRTATRAPAPATTPRPAPVAEVQAVRPAATATTQPRYVVRCSGRDCSKLLPARGPRAVVAYCKKDAAKRDAAASKVAARRRAA